MTKFQIQTQDGAFIAVSHDEFFALLNSGLGYLYYSSGGIHLALLPTPENTQTLQICRQADNVENRILEANGRCLDINGRLCRYQHDEYGNFIRNAKGRPLAAKCGDCPRNGWMNGKKENCCIRLYCKTPDCSQCMSLRENRLPLSLEHLDDDNFVHGATEYDCPATTDDIAGLLASMEENELHAILHSAIKQLPSPEREVVIAISLKAMTLRAFAEESGISKSAIQRIHKRAISSLEKSLKDFY